MDAITHICQCGCEQPIPPKRGHRFKAPRYLLGHASRDPRIKAKVADTYRSAIARPSDAPVYRCQCGCDEEIPWRRRHATRPPRYIQQHYLRDDTTERVRALRAAKFGKRIEPPSGWTAPSGLCACGCGKPTRIATTTRPERGEYVGHPRKWCHGHHAKALLATRGPEHPAWTGGRYSTKLGYVFLHKPEHPTAQADGYIPEHRYVYETTRGITLPKGVVVHHINGVKHDNRPENLVATTRGAHTRLHLRAAQVISLFLDDRLMDAAKEFVRSVGELPDIALLTAQVYGSH